MNVMPDLAVAMQQNPNLKVQLNGGYYDLATPYFAAVYELHQLPIQASLQDNIEMHFYTSGHMVYAHEPALKELHANVAAFIEKTRNGRRRQISYSAETPRSSVRLCERVNAMNSRI
jgi:carboxypeptidase C (cathepsin A)